MTNAAKAKPSIYDISPYVAGESSKKTEGREVKLSSNEGAFGASPKAIEALKAMAANMYRYPDGGCTKLRNALAEKNGFDVSTIVCGAGSDEIISLLCGAYAGEGDEVLYSEHGFLMYPISAKVAGATPVTAPEKDLRADPEALLNAVTDKTKIVFLANPNNPTGSYLTKDEVKDFHAALPSDVLLVLDAAYAEYVEADDYSIGHELVDAHDNVVVTRTFSKIYGMGGLRIGWGHCSAPVADILNRVRGPFNVNSAAQAAALAALGDDEFVTKCRKHNTKCLDYTKSELEKLGLKVYPSVGNFLLVSFETQEKADAARLFLNERNIFIRQMGAYGLAECLRITIGTDEEMELVISAIQDYLKS